MRETCSEVLTLPAYDPGTCSDWAYGVCTGVLQANHLVRISFPIVQSVNEEQKSMLRHCYGQVIAFANELGEYTLEVIIKCFIGEAGRDEKTLPEIIRLTRDIAAGLTSIPIRFPWPLNKVNSFHFGPSLDARNKLIRVFDGIIKQRRALLQACPAGQTVSGGGVLDRMILAQEDQKKAGGLAEGELLMDDQFIYDNVRILGVLYMLFQGSRSSSDACARGGPFRDGKDLKACKNGLEPCKRLTSSDLG